MALSFSIVIPTYRRPALLKKCLDVLKLQTFPASDYEIIVVSDGRDPATKALMVAYGETAGLKSRLRFAALPSNKGPAAVRNKGWQMAAGRLVAFTDDDCMPSIYWLSAFWKAYNQETYWVASGKVVVPRPRRPTDYQQNIARLETAHFVTANCCCSRAALALVGGFDERFRTAWREDSDLAFRLERNHIWIRKVPEAVVIHPVRQAGWGVSLKEQKKSMFNALLYKKHPLFYRESIQRCPPWHYYLMVVAFLLFWINIMFIRSTLLLIVFGSIWVIGCCWFIWFRLSGRTLRAGHVLEMILTSLFIPFLSIFWRLYGSFKFRVLFI